MNSEPQHYYDEFSANYENERHRGYHRFIDDLEVEYALKYCRGRTLEAGCGTGLILQRIAPHVDDAFGIDLSGGMLWHALKKDLRIVQGSVDALPFPSNYFDAIVSFKVLAHVPNIRNALEELSRITKPGGYLVLEFYNRLSLRYLVKRLKDPSATSDKFSDEDIYTRYDTLNSLRAYLPSNLRLIDTRGVRVLTPIAKVHDLPVLGPWLSAAERWSADNRLTRRFGGFLIMALQKN